MTLSVKGLPHRREELSLDPSLPLESWAQWCLSVTPVLPDKWVSGSLLNSRSNQISELQVEQENVSQKIRHMAMHVDLHAPIYHTYTHTQEKKNSGDKC